MNETFNSNAAPPDPPSRGLKAKLSQPGVMPLIICSLLTGLAFAAVFVLGQVYAGILSSDRIVAYFYSTDEAVRYVFDICYSVFCVALPFVVVFVISKFIPSVRFRIPKAAPKGGWKTVLLIIGGMGVCFIGNLLTSYLSQYVSSMGFGFRSYTDAVRESALVPTSPMLLALYCLRTALVPAVAEEFCFRGVVMQPLRRYGDTFAIVISSVLFGLLHGNMTQAPFAILAGLALGYTCVKTGSLAGSVILHFCNNFFSVIYSFIMTAVPSNATAAVGALVNYLIIFCGLLSVAFILIADKHWFRIGKNRTSLRFGSTAGFYVLQPSMLLVILWMLWSILGDIVLF